MYNNKYIYIYIYICVYTYHTYIYIYILYHHIYIYICIHVHDPSQSPALQLRLTSAPRAADAICWTLRARAAFITPVEGCGFHMLYYRENISRAARSALVAEA